MSASSCSVSTYPSARQRRVTATRLVYLAGLTPPRRTWALHTKYIDRFMHAQESAGPFRAPTHVFENPILQAGGSLLARRGRGAPCPYISVPGNQKAKTNYLQTNRKHCCICPSLPLSLLIGFIHLWRRRGMAVPPVGLLGLRRGPQPLAILHVCCMRRRKSVGAVGGVNCSRRGAFPALRPRRLLPLGGSASRSRSLSRPGSRPPLATRRAPAAPLRVSNVSRPSR